MKRVFNIITNSRCTKECHTECVQDEVLDVTFKLMDCPPVCCFYNKDYKVQQKVSPKILFAVFSAIA